MEFARVFLLVVSSIGTSLGCFPRFQRGLESDRGRVQGLLRPGYSSQPAVTSVYNAKHFLSKVIHYRLSGGQDLWPPFIKLKRINRRVECVNQNELAKCATFDEIDKVGNSASNNHANRRDN